MVTMVSHLTTPSSQSLCRIEGDGWDILMASSPPLAMLNNTSSPTLGACNNVQ